MFYLTLCAIGLLGEVNLVGRLILTDILLTGALPFLILRNASHGHSALDTSHGHSALAKQFFFFAALWFFGAVITDIIRQTPFEDFSRGWSKIFFFMTNFASIYILVNGHRKRIVAFIFMLCIMGAVRLRMDGSGFGLELFSESWRFGYGQLVTEVTLLISAALVSNLVTSFIGMALPFIDAILNITLSARALFALSGLSGLALVVTMGRNRARSPTFVLTTSIAGLLAVWAMASVYSYAAGSGLLGFEAMDKYQIQASGNLGTLLGGRTESFASTQAIIDSPIIGHGSWARNMYYVELLVTRLERAGYDIVGSPLSDDLIPSHSHFFGAWVEAGILGAVFWLWAGWLTIRGLYAAMIRPTPLTGFVVFIGLSLLWDILFSPFGLDRRVLTPAWLILMILTIEDVQDGKRQSV